MPLPSGPHLSAAQRRTLSADPWFARLPQPQQQALVSAAVLTHWRRGARIYQHGEVPQATGSGFCGLVSGTVKLSTLSENGAEAIFAVLEPGSWFGEIALIDGGTRAQNATALGDADLLVVSAASFDALMGDVAFSHAVSQLLATRTRLLFAFMEDWVLRGLRERIARRLLVLARGDATQQLPLRQTVSLAQEALAMMVGVTRQTLSRELNAMAQDGVIALGYGHIDLNFAALERCLQEH